MEKQFEIGSVLHFDITRFTSTINFWNKYLIPGIKKIWTAYNDLNIGEFDKDVLLLAVHRFPVFEKGYMEFLENEWKKSRDAFNRTFYSEAQIWEKLQMRLLGIKTAVSELNAALLSLTTVMLPISLNDCEVTTDAIIVDQDRIKAECTLEIKNQDQLEVWNAWTNVVNQYNAALDLLISKGFVPNSLNVLGGRGFVAETMEGRLELSPECILNVATQADLAGRENSKKIEEQGRLAHEAEVKRQQELLKTEVSVQPGLHTDVVIQKYIRLYIL